MELETGLFRLLDETLAAFLAGRPDRLEIQLDWGDQLEARVVAERRDEEAAGVDGAAVAAGPDAAGAAEASKPGGKPAGARSGGRAASRSVGRSDDAASGEEMPAALAAMIEDRRVDSTEAAAEAARLAAWIPLSPSAWREIQGRAATLGISAELLSDGTEVRLVAELGPPDADS